MKDSVILSDTQYKYQMEHLVLPYLKERMSTFWLEREKGNKIYCISYQSESPRGTILISHGFTETSEKYMEVAYYFVCAGYHIYIIDHCGHGHSYRLVRDPSLVHIDQYERYVDDLLFAAQFAKEANSTLPLYLYGHSMGGGIAAAAAAFSPQLFHKVILSSPMIRPSTGNAPWFAACLISTVFCKSGKSGTYVLGQKPYQGNESFENSASLSRERFSFYSDIRDRNPLFHLNAASYGWLHEAMRLNHFLQSKGWKQIQAPVLLFQAGKDTFISEDEQNLFVTKLNRRNPSTHIGKNTVPFAKLIRIPEAKHEIFNSNTAILEKYWSEIFDFLN